MKKAIIMLFIVLLLVLQIVAVSAMTPSEAREAWKETKKHSREMQEQHREAKLMFAGGKNPEHEQDVIDTGKASLHAALEEAEAWLVWKKLEAEDNDEIPDELRDQILEDVELNLEKIDDLRGDVDAITTRFELGVTFLKMVGKYFELLTDVARNSGNVWVFIGNERADKIEEYVNTLMETAEDDGVIDQLNLALEELESARENIDNAEEAYAQVTLPGTPMIKFSEGNNYLRVARTELMAAHRHLADAYRMMVR